MKRFAICGGMLVVLWALDRLTAGLSFRLLDGHLYYSYSYASRLIASLSPEERRTYVRLAMGDLVFIAAYTPSLLYFLRRDVLWKESLVYAPVFTGLCDLLETGTILLVLVDKLPPIALWVPTFATPLKWMGVAACFLALLTRRWPEPRKTNT